MSMITASMGPLISSATLWPENLCRTLQDDAVSFGNFRDYCRHLSYNYTILSGNTIRYECGKTF